MPPFLVNILKSRTFKVVLGVIAAAVLAWSQKGCAPRVAKPSLAVIDCQVAVLEPYVGSLAAELVREINGNQAFNPMQFLLASGVDVRDIPRIAAQYHACVPADGAGATLGSDAGS